MIRPEQLKIGDMVWSVDVVPLARNRDRSHASAQGTR